MIQFVLFVMLDVRIVMDLSKLNVYPVILRLNLELLVIPNVFARIIIFKMEVKIYVLVIKQKYINLIKVCYSRCYLCTTTSTNCTDCYTAT